MLNPHAVTAADRLDIANDLFHLLFERLNLVRRQPGFQLRPHVVEQPDYSIAHHLSCHTGTRPAVHGAPTVSSTLSSFARSTSVSVFSFASVTLNSSAAMLYCSCCDWVGRSAERRMR